MRKKLTYTLLAAAMFIGIAAQPTRANCLVNITWSDGTTGFLSCGSSSGTYVAHRLADGSWESWDGGFFDEVICAMVC